MSDYGDLITGTFGGERRQAQTNAVANISASPEKATRALELSRATGVNPNIIEGDVEGFEDQHKQTLASDIVGNNSYISDYLTKDPMHAKLSNDDYGNLDAVSQATSKVGEDTTLGRAIKGFKEGYDLEGQLKEISKLDNFVDHPIWKTIMQQPVVSSVVGGVVGFDTFMRAFGGMVNAAGAAIGSPETMEPGLSGDTAPSPAWGMRLARDVIGIANVAMSGQAGLHGPAGGPKIPELPHAAEAAKARDAVAPYIEAGKVPPVGIHPIIDELHKQQSNIDLKNLDELLKEAQASKTRERNPDIFADFVRQHTDASIGISGDKIAELYGDKVPTPDDGKLGWVPNLAAQLEEAKATGSDINIPLADWVAKVDPALAKELHDDIRVRPEGITKNEQESMKDQKALEEPKVEEPAPKEGEQPVAPEPIDPRQQTVDDIRKASGLDLAEQRDIRTLKLKLEDSAEYPIGGKGHTFSFVDETGRDTGYLNLTESPDGKKLHVDNIESRIHGFEPNSFGPKLMRDLLRQLKEQFPNAEELFGHRVTGAREKADAVQSKGAIKVALENPSAIDLQKLSENIKSTWVPYTDAIHAKLRPREEYTRNEQQIVKAVNAEVKKLGLKDVDVHDVDALTIGKSGEEGQSATGAYQRFHERQPLILWALESPDAVSTLRHEAIHHLFREGFFKPEEWSTLKRTAVQENWIDKHDIMGRYGDAPHRVRLEEAIAEEFANWRKDGKPKKYDDYIQVAFDKLAQLLDAIKLKIKDILGKEPTADDLFQKVESGEIGQREGNKPLPEQDVAAQLGEKEAFEKAAAIGMTVDQYKRYQKLIEKRQKEDIEASIERAMKDQKKRQTDEWKENSAVERKEAAADVNQRPDVMTYEALKRNEMKLDPKMLTLEQQQLLPDEFKSAKGVNPDDIAGFFGYSSGSALVDHLNSYTSQMKAANMRPEEFKRRLVGAETERRMQRKYGDLGQNILDEAKDQVISETQIDMLHEETLALGLKANLEFTLSKDAIKGAALDQFNNLLIRDISTDKYLADAGRAGRMTEMHALKDEWLDAFKTKQQQYLALLKATEAKKLEKLQKQFEKLAKRYSKREVTGALTEYTNYIQDLLIKLGQPVRRSVQDLQEAISKEGYKSLESFVETKEGDLRELHMPDWLQDANFKKNLDDLTAAEFKQANDAMKAMAFNARDEMKVIKAGEKADLSDVLKEMKDQLKEVFGEEKRKYPIDRPANAVTETLKSYLWSGITVESMMNRLDRGNVNGVFNQYIVRPFTTASNFKDRLIKEFQGKVSDIGKIPDIDKLVDNTVFKDRDTGEFFPMRKRNVLGVLQNVGNESNMKKLAGGYGVEPDVIMSWLARHTTKEDWDRAQKLGDIFGEAFKGADEMSHQISGVGIEKLPLKPIETPFGTYAGWYNPIKYDPLRPGQSRALLGKSVEEEGFYRATTPQGYTEKRTGYIAPLELNLDVIPVRMKQMLHDTAMRPAVLQLSKFFYNPEFKRMLIDHFGQHQAESMIPFLRDIANQTNFQSMEQSIGNKALEYMRQNLIATLIGFNPGTVMKHGTTALFNSFNEVGTKNWATEFFGLMKGSPEAQKSNWRMAMDKSEELQRRMRNFGELISGHGQEINLKGANSKFMSFRDFATSAGATPVSISDLLSAVPTWLAKYKDAIAKGDDEGTAVFEADRAVRRAHGSSIQSNKPAIARTNALGATFSSLYGFFSHMQNKMYELGWKQNEAFNLVREGEFKEAAKRTPELLNMYMSYVIIPAIVEEMVTPYTNSEKESWGLKAAKTLGLGVSSSFIGVRDFVRGLVNLRDPSAGLIGTGLKTISDVGRDISHGSAVFSKEKRGNLIKHSITLIGLLTGMMNAQEGKMAQYAGDVISGKEHPKGFGDLLKGLRHGTTKGKH